MSETVIEHVLRRLKEIGVDAIFGVPGDFAFSAQDAIVNHPDPSVGQLPPPSVPQWQTRKAEWYS